MPFKILWCTQELNVRTYAAAAKAQWHRVADQLRPKLPKVAATMDKAEVDVLVYMDMLPAMAV